MSRPRPTPPRPRLFAQGAALYQGRGDEGPDLLAELATPEIASPLASAPRLERTPGDARELVHIIWGGVGSPTRDEEVARLHEIEARMRHARRVASGERFACRLEDRRFTAAPGRLATRHERARYPPIS